MKNLFKFIPGFRSNTRWKKIIACIYYLISILPNANNFGGLLFMLSLPFFTFGLIDLFKAIKNKTPYKNAAIIILAALIILTIGVGNLENINSNTADKTKTPIESQESQENEEVETSDINDNKYLEINTSTSEEDDTLTPSEKDKVEGKIEVHFIDVGQADSILIKTFSGESMLIDAGNNADSNLVTNYIKNQGISKLDIVVGTHPHEDHIGGLDAVINNFDIGKAYMPKTSTTTQTYEDVLNAISNKGLKISSPVSVSTFSLGEANFTILAPNSSNYDDLNNSSIVLKMEYGNNAFLFTGDAEDISEKEIINKGYNLSADVLKIGHHGSESSTTESFLNKVNPKYAVIMVGEDNSYGHPHKVTMDKLKSKNIAVYRTDENETIIATSDGSNITFSTEPGSYTAKGKESTSSSNETTADRTVYWTPNGKSYHYSKDCQTLSRSKTILSGTLSECPKDDPCDKCTY